MSPINTTPCFSLGTVTLKNEKECQWGLASFCAMNRRSLPTPQSPYHEPQTVCVPLKVPA